MLAAATGLLDYAEDFATLRLTRGKEARPSRFGYWKWLFFFTTTGLQALPAIRAFEQSPWEWVGLDHHGGIGGRWGIFATLKKSFDGIRRGAAFAAVGLLGVGLYPIIGVLPLPVSLLVTYAMLERVPACFALLLAVALPLAGKSAWSSGRNSIGYVRSLLCGHGVRGSDRRDRSADLSRCGRSDCRFRQNFFANQPALQEWCKQQRRRFISIFALLASLRVFFSRSE